MTNQEIGAFFYDYGFPAYEDIVTKLPEVLSDGEELIAILEGRTPTENGKQSEYIILTNNRLLFLHFPFWGDVKISERQFHKIASTSFKKGMLNGELLIFWEPSGSGVTAFTRCNNKLGQKFSDVTNEFLSNLRKPFSQSKERSETIGQPNVESLAGKLRELAKLKDEGILTEEEFAQQKAKLLN